ncbi:hypothetical protein AMATHDRAFT_69602 [Amanita thiersii Skay4041]|uniref:Small ribosomal subunit protein uS10m n=1 Tax=Amanita thiersii Skay4041 TaxID=703135 RepID=A0A2A9N995_9AGAR|nr:hypothetical protein AMATHDRAFT_69602 [Amanita thiersii Skay4041]
MLALALAHRSLFAVRCVLPAVVAAPRWSGRCKSTDSHATVNNNLGSSGGITDKEAKELDEIINTLSAEGSEMDLPSLSLGGTQEVWKGGEKALSVEDPDEDMDLSSLPLPEVPDLSQGPLSEKRYAASYVPGRALYEPFLHPRTHSIPVATIHFRSHLTEQLELFTHFASHAATALGIPISRVVKLPTQRSLWTVLKSPFVHKKSQENFERRVHKRMIKAWDADGEVVDRWVRYLVRHGIGGVGMRIVRWDRVPVGVGRKRLEDVAELLRSREEELEGPKVVEGEIRKLGENIVRQEMSQQQQQQQQSKQ